MVYLSTDSHLSKWQKPLDSSPTGIDTLPLSHYIRHLCLKKSITTQYNYYSSPFTPTTQYSLITIVVRPRVRNTA